MTDPGDPVPSADSGGLLQKLQAGVAWFQRQSENTRIGLIVGASLVGPIAFVAIYSFLSDNLVTILILFAAMAVLSTAGSAAWYLRLRRQNLAEERRHAEENQLACPSCLEWNDKDEEFCRNCARPFKDQKMLADFLAYKDQRDAREQRERSAPAPRALEPAQMVPAVPIRRERVLAARQSFTGYAVITMLLYLFLCWPVGAIVNLVWLSEAETIYRLTGNSPAGRGCLKILGVVFILVPFALMVFLALVVFLQHKGVPVLTPQE